jgi:hypothetical protein
MSRQPPHRPDPLYSDPRSPYLEIQRELAKGLKPHYHVPEEMPCRLAALLKRFDREQKK